MKTKFLLLIIAALVVALAAWPAAGMPSLTNFTDHVHILTTGGTATPALRVNQLGAGKLLEILDGGTPVFSINNGGGIVASTILTQGAVITNLVVSAPTAVGTATPAAVINNDGVSNLLEVRDSSTPVFTVGQNGAAVFSGTLALEGVAFSGPVVFGSVTATDGLTITHGLGTTPTMILLEPVWATDTITQEWYVSDTGSVTFALQISTGALTTTTVYWQAGR